MIVMMIINNHNIIDEYHIQLTKLLNIQHDHNTQIKYPMSPLPFLSTLSAAQYLLFLWSDLT